MTKTDLALYQAVARRVGEGSDYYSTVASLHREMGYPLDPFFAVRLPTLAYINAALGPIGSMVLGLILVFVAALVWNKRLADMPLSVRAVAIVIITVFAANGLTSGVTYLHDWWAGLLITIALGLQPNWRMAFVAGFAAAVIRELAIPFLLLFPLVYKQRVVLLWTLAALTVCGALIAFHAVSLWAIQMPSDLHSQGWFGHRGLRAFPNDVAKLTEIERLGSFGYLLIAVPLLGWAISRDWLAIIWIFGVVLLVSFVSRPDNFYWAQMAIPSYLTGWVFLGKLAIRSRGQVQTTTE